MAKGKEKKKEGEIGSDSPIVREFRLWNHVCGISLTRVEPINQVDSSEDANPILKFSCAICDRFGTINRERFGILNSHKVSPSPLFGRTVLQKLHDYKYLLCALLYALNAGKLTSTKITYFAMFFGAMYSGN